MPGGRRPKPTQLKVVQGNPGRRPLNEDEPTPERVAPMCPDHVSEKAREVWDDLAAVLLNMGVLTEADAYAFERLAECYAEVVDCRESIEEHGRTYATRTQSGGVMVRPRPEVAMLADADRRFRAYLVEFGLTPAARSKVKADGGAGDDQLAAYFR